MRVLFLVLMALLAGCSASPEEIQLQREKIALMKTVAEQPTISCESNCDGLKYFDPRRNLNALFPRETNGWDTANKALDIISNSPVGLSLAIGKTLSDTVKEVVRKEPTYNNSNNTYTHNANQHSEANQANSSVVTTNHSTSDSYNQHTENNPVNMEDNDTDSSQHNSNNSSESTNSNSETVNNNPAPTPPPVVDNPDTVDE